MDSVAFHVIAGDPVSSAGVGLDHEDDEVAVVHGLAHVVFGELIGSQSRAASVALDFDGELPAGHVGDSLSEAFGVELVKPTVIAEWAVFACLHQFDGFGAHVVDGVGAAGFDSCAELHECEGEVAARCFAHGCSGVGNHAALFIGVVPEVAVGAPLAPGGGLVLEVVSLVFGERLSGVCEERENEGKEEGEGDGAPPRSMEVTGRAE